MVGIVGHGVEGGDLGGRAVLLGREDMRAEAEPRGRHGGHAAELAAADNADHGAWG